MYKGVTDLHADEELTDNSKIDYCIQCKDCAFWGNSDDPFTNAHDKACCDQYPYPAMKPLSVINNEGKCTVYLSRRRG